MADFALWATACESALWPPGTFWAAYCGNRDEAVEGVSVADPVAAAVRAFMAVRTEWTGTASNLLGALAEQAGDHVVKAKTWPDALSRGLCPAACGFRGEGLTMRRKALQHQQRTAAHAFQACTTLYRIHHPEASLNRRGGWWASG